MTGKIERWFPLLIGFFAAASYLYFFRDYSLPDSVKDLFSTSIGISSIAVGFLATALSILFSIDKKYIIRQLKNTGIYNKLINYFMNAINWSFVLAVVSGIGLLMNFKKHDNWHSVAFATWLFVLTTTACSCYRVINIFASILRSPD